LLTGEITGLGVTRLLEGIRIVDPTIRFYQASTSEMFGKVQAVPQDEMTRFYPRSPYGVSKLYGHWITVNYRESYGLFACSGILFNHESPRRGAGVRDAQSHQRRRAHQAGASERTAPGQSRGKRDWGYAGDYVEAMWLMLQQDEPTTTSWRPARRHSVRELVEVAFRCVDLDWRNHVVIDQKFVRPAEVDLLIGDPAKARRKLGWRPKVSFATWFG